MDALQLRCPSCGHTIPPDGVHRFCAACGAPLPVTGETATSPAPFAPRPAPVRAVPDAGGGGRFLPGSMFAGRYRIAGLLGRGGMGEVYRADDLKLGQPVALKFLPGDVERDSDRLERFMTEVRMSLRVTHPNVCRVFDVGQIEQRHFLSMEYVDGEDLASLLRRIGRLPEDKAIEIARQLCAGLAAAHEEGVLHRDLKPANIMIDGRGRAKIADFGLAGATAGISGGEARAGTPQYMAPEQVAGRELSERTDLYALGLVLYEIFTGKRAFEIKNLDDLQRLQSSAPTSPSSHVSGLNPLVERAILRCLESDPVKRPPSASALAAALPGGDPLAMAIAAGDTPSPEMVAAAGSDQALRAAIAWPLLGVAIAGMVLVSILAGQVSLQRVGAPAKPPDVLIERARDVLRTVGLGERTLDHAWGLWPDHGYLNYAALGAEPERRDVLAARALMFWYRESPVLLERLATMEPDLIPRIGFNDPNLRFSGEARVTFDRDGRLLSLAAIPTQFVRSLAVGREPDWAPLFRAAGLDMNEWTGTEPQWTPFYYGDRRLAWVPEAVRLGDGPVRVEAASYQGRPVNFSVIFPWTVPERDLATRRTEAERIGNLVMVLIVTAVMIGGALVARHNLRLDRGDRRGAARLGVFVSIVMMLVWIIDESHVPSIWELYLFITAFGWAVFLGSFVAVLYLALEPYVRRTWPAMIVSWSRVIAGSIRDPLVARDVLIGCAMGGVVFSLDIASYLLAYRVNGVLPRLFTSPRPFYGPLYVSSELAIGLVVAIMVALFYLFVLFSLRQLLRREWLAIVVGSLLLAVPNAMATGAALAGLPVMFVQTAALFATLSRVGLIATIAAVLVSIVLYAFPVTFPPNAWYGGVGLAGLAFMVGLAIAAFRIATAPPERTRAPAV